MRLAGSEKTQHATDILYEVFATSRCAGTSNRPTFAGRCSCNRSHGYEPPSARACCRSVPAPFLRSSTRPRLRGRRLASHRTRAAARARMGGAVRGSLRAASSRISWSLLITARSVAPDGSKRSGHKVEFVDGQVEVVQTGRFRPSPHFCEARGSRRALLDPSRILDVAGEPRMLPDDQTGFVFEEPSNGKAMATFPRPSTSLGDAGFVVQFRTTVERITDFLDEPRASRARWLQVRAPAGSGISTTLRLVAREVRLKGFLPIAGSVVEGFELGNQPGRLLRDLLPLMTCRHVVVLNDRPGTCSGAQDEDGCNSVGTERPSRLVSAVLELRAVMPHADITVVSVSDRETSCSWVTLDPLHPNQLLSMVGLLSTAVAACRCFAPRTHRGGGLADSSSVQA